MTKLTSFIGIFIFIFTSCIEDETNIKNSPVSSTTLMSANGSSRATAYIDSNKIVETEEKIFITYLTFEKGKQLIVVRYFDKEKKRWSKEKVLDVVQDNHGGGSLTIDSKGYFHIAYGPHVGPIIYRKSVLPNDISIWEDPVLIGSVLTYPSLAIDNDDKLYLLGRHTISQGSWSLRIFYKDQGNSTWSAGKDLLYSNFDNWPLVNEAESDNPKNLSIKNGYTRWNKSIAIDQSNNLHITFKNYEYLPRSVDYDFTNERNGGSYFIGYMKSEDGGLTWTNDGKKLQTPAYPADVEIIDGSSNPLDVDSNFGISNVILDNKNIPHIVYSKEFEYTSTLNLAFKENDQWVHKLISDGNEDNSFSYSPSSITFFENHFYVVATAMDKNHYDREHLWGNVQDNSFLQIFQLNSFYEIVNVYSSKDLLVNNPSWLPSLSRGSTFSPKLLFTQGNSKLDKTNVYFTILK